jgi:hypothetical protein
VIVKKKLYFLWLHWKKKIKKSAMLILNYDSKLTDHIPLPVDDDYKYEIPKPLTDSDSEEASNWASEYYSPTPYEYQDDVDYEAGKYDD